MPLFNFSKSLAASHLRQVPFECLYSLDVLLLLFDLLSPFRIFVVVAVVRNVLDVYCALFVDVLDELRFDSS